MKNKKILTIVLCLVVLFGITGCSEKQKKEKSSNSSNKEYKLNNKDDIKKLYGTSIKLNDGNKMSVANGEIDDNFKIFYTDKDNVYIIYGDYYPVYSGDESKNVQTPVDGVKFEYKGDVRKIYTNNKDAFIKYLRNDSKSALKDEDTKPDGTYESWKDLKDALENVSSKLGSKVKYISGSPTLTMWVNSWNAKGYTKLSVKWVEGSGQFGTKGYYVGKKDDEKNFYNLRDVDGYKDTLYFPYRESNDFGHGYYLASPAGQTSFDTAIRVTYYGTIGNDTDYDRLSTRPLLIIPISDFNKENSEGIKITK